MKATVLPEWHIFAMLILCVLMVLLMKNMFDIILLRGMFANECASFSEIWWFMLDL
tara:strand:+ start:1338 stop:1505 length:168 start_codon:yes stop_codon:yes gene_type:complete